MSITNTLALTPLHRFAILELMKRFSHDVILRIPHCRSEKLFFLVLVQTAVWTRTIKVFLLSFLFLIFDFLFLSSANALESQTYYYHTDQVGSVVAVSDENGNLVQQSKYTPYGTQTIVHSNNSTIGVIPETKVTERNYTGQIKDNHTVLSYYKARYYDPVVSRFISADIVNDQQNRYNYVGGNPVMKNDPSGNQGNEPNDMVSSLRQALKEKRHLQPLPIVGGQQAIPNLWEINQMDILETVNQLALELGNDPYMDLTIAVNEGLGIQVRDLPNALLSNKINMRKTKILTREYRMDKNTKFANYYETAYEAISKQYYQFKVWQEHPIVGLFGVNRGDELYQGLIAAGYYKGDEKIFGESEDTFTNLSTALEFQAKLIANNNRLIFQDWEELGINTDMSAQFKRYMTAVYYNAGSTSGKKFMKYAATTSGFSFQDRKTWGPWNGDDNRLLTLFKNTNREEATYCFYTNKCN